MLVLHVMMLHIVASFSVVVVVCVLKEIKKA